MLKGLDLTLGSGEVLGLLGRNGAGKSTLVDVVTGRLRPDAGVMVLGEHDYRPQSPEAARAAGVSVIEQEFEPPVDLTVEQAVLRRLDGERGEEERRALVREALEAVGVELDLGTLVGSLDPAEQALVEVARVVAEQPRLVVVDEASVSLDDREIAHVHAGVRVLRERGCGVVYIAHRLDELHAIADRVAVVRDGVAADSIPTRGSTPADLAFALLRHEVEERPPRPARERGEATLRVRGLRTENVVDLDLDIDAGEVVGLVGTRASGATEVAQAIAGERTSEVDLFAVGHERFDSPTQARERVAALGGRFEYDTQTIAETLGQASTAQTAAGRLRDAASLVRHLSIATDDVHGPVATLSGGDRQKVTVASASRVEQPVIVLSQPTRSVDVGARRRVHEIVDTFVDGGKAVLLVTNDLTELLELSHRVVVVHDGRAVADLVAARTDPDEVMSYVETGAAPAPAPVRRRRRRAAVGS
ncbi:MAG TPA: ATP-binding cassette domain-containing protein [Actinotalea caeni]|uniref:ATP-binding cassette domain-containing protein n=1 Tax=Actinotalea caeni TaxID=1348467 RepID=UPI002B4AE89F|nr:ATP-binding cassette domain-containing protein [Actinotalea caeni]HLV55706.1 ATP-binding cassette domain-containing protein [Actinotalea caeni]